MTARPLSPLTLTPTTMEATVSGENVVGQLKQYTFDFALPTSLEPG